MINMSHEKYLVKNNFKKIKCWYRCIFMNMGQFIYNWKVLISWFVMLMTSALLGLGFQEEGPVVPFCVSSSSSVFSSPLGLEVASAQGQCTERSYWNQQSWQFFATRLLLITNRGYFTSL